MADLATIFTGIRFENPFLLASAPPTESESNILRAFEAGWGGVVTKTIGLHPVVNVRGPKTTFLRADIQGSRLSMAKRADAALVASWNWELISDKPLDWWIPRLEAIKRAYPSRVLVASIMAGSGTDKELDNWQVLTRAVQDAGADAIELNFSCPHMDRVDMGSNVGRDKVLCSISTQVVKAVARVPVWVKLTPATADIVEEAGATFLGGADAVSSSNTFPSLPPIDPATLDFEINVDGLVSPGGLGGPAIFAQSLAKMAQMTQAFPDRAFSGIGGIADFTQALSYFLIGCGTVQVATAAMLDHAIGPNVIRALTSGMSEFLDRMPTAAGPPSTTSVACAAAAWSPTPGSRVRTSPATTAGTRMRPKATRPIPSSRRAAGSTGPRQGAADAGASGEGDTDGGRLPGDAPLVGGVAVVDAGLDGAGRLPGNGSDGEGAALPGLRLGAGDPATVRISWQRRQVESARRAWSIGRLPTSCDLWQSRHDSRASAWCGYSGGARVVGLWHSQHSSSLRPTMLVGRWATLPWQLRQCWFCSFE